MSNFFECLFSQHALAYGTAAIIFFITLVLAAKRVIGFFLTLLFLLFALAAGMLIANPAVFHHYFEKDASDSSSTAAFKEDVIKTYDEIKSELEIQKEKLSKLIHDKEGTKAP